MSTTTSTIDEKVREDIPAFLRDGEQLSLKIFRDLTPNDFTEMRRLMKLTFLGSQIESYSQQNQRLSESFHRLYGLYTARYSAKQD